MTFLVEFFFESVSLLSRSRTKKGCLRVFILLRVIRIVFYFVGFLGNNFADQYNIKHFFILLEMALNYLQIFLFFLLWISVGKD